MHFEPKFGKSLVLWEGIPRRLKPGIEMQPFVAEDVVVYLNLSGLIRNLNDFKFRLHHRANALDLVIIQAYYSQAD